MIDWNGLIISVLGASLLLALLRISRLNGIIKDANCVNHAMEAEE